MTQWITRQLTDRNCFEFLTGLWTGKAAPLENAVVIRNTNFRNDGRLDLSNVAVLNVESRQLDSKRLEKGDIIIERSGGGPKQPVGRVCFFNETNDEPYSFSNFTSTLRIKDKQVFFPLFVHYYLLHLYMEGFTAPLQRATTGIRNLDFGAYQQAEIPQPKRSEQEKIAAVLWKLQRAIETEEKLIATAGELKQSVMRQLFAYGLQGLARKETAIGPVPENWRVDRLIKFAHFQRGYDITKKGQTHGIVPVVSSGGIRSWHDVAAATGPGVVIGRKGSIGTVHYVEQDYWPHDTTLFATDFCGNFPLFVYYRLCVLDLKRLDSGAANPALNRNFLHEELISWPNAGEQREIASILQTIDRKISLHKSKCTTLQDLFKTLLRVLMTGEIQVADWDVDVSEVTA